MKKPFRVKLTLIFSLIMYLIIRLHAVWSRTFTPGWNSIVVIIGILIGIVLILLFLFSATQLFLNSQYKRKISYLPVFLIPILFIDAVYNPLNINLDRLYGKVIYKAHYEGSISNAYFTIRNNNKFEINYTTAPFFETYWRGKYIQSNDTLYLEYNGEKPHFDWGTKVLKIDGHGIVLSDTNNQLYKHPFFWEIEIED